jgi:hypothetical protein
VRTIRLLERNVHWPYHRHSPAGDGHWKGTRFLFGREPGTADWLAVTSLAPRGLRFPKNRTILIAGEPDAHTWFHPEYVMQFGTVLTTDPLLQHPASRLGYHALPWHVGIDWSRPDPVSTLSYAQLAASPTKTRLCACICSTESRRPGHRRRLAFVAQLKAALGDRIDFYGRGFRDMADKAEALDAYRYHIVLENASIDHYWTEKLADAYLRNCFPIYSGAPNVGDYFDAAAFAPIDIDHPDEAIRTIAAILESDLDRRAHGAIAAAKHLVMDRYNMLEQLATLAAELEQAAPLPDKPVLLRTQRWYKRRDGRRTWLRRLLGRG